MADDMSGSVRYELSDLANFGPIPSKLGRSVAFVVVVVVAWSADAGAPCERSIVPFCGQVRTILLPVIVGWGCRRLLRETQLMSTRDTKICLVVVGGPSGR